MPKKNESHSCSLHKASDRMTSIVAEFHGVCSVVSINLGDADAVKHYCRLFPLSELNFGNFLNSQVQPKPSVYTLCA